MNAFTLLKADHEKVAGILDKIDETTERATKGREELFAQLKNELDVHARIEEEILYPVLEEYEETRAICFEAYEEHALVKQLLEDLASAPKDDGFSVKTKLKNWEALTGGLSKFKNRQWLDRSCEPVIA